jgi:DNA-binding MarR family transcriptional regulator
MEGPKREPTLPLVTDLQRAVHVLGLHLEAALADLRLSQGEIHVLSLLGDGGTMSVADLQRGVRHRPSTLTGILDRLGARGLVERRINDADRRSYLIELTPAGQDAAARVIAAMTEIESRLLAGRTPEEIEGVRAILDEIAGSL